jgi:hypothetical protein
MSKGTPVPAERRVMGNGLKLKGVWRDGVKNVPELAYKA